MDLQAAIASGDKAWQTHGLLAHSHIELEEWPKAIAASDQAEESGAPRWQMQYARALVFSRQKKWRDAIPLRKDASATGGGRDANVWEVLGWAEAELGHFPSAVMAFQRAVELAPQDRELLLWLGHAQLAAEQLLLSDAFLGRSQTSDPQPLWPLS